jgi:hypothetical protein
MKMDVDNVLSEISTRYSPEFALNTLFLYQLYFTQGQTSGNILVLRRPMPLLVESLEKHDESLMKVILGF